MPEETLRDIFEPPPQEGEEETLSDIFDVEEMLESLEVDPGEDVNSDPDDVIATPVEPAPDIAPPAKKEEEPPLDEIGGHVMESPVLREFRATSDGQHYDDWTDDELAEALYDKFYAKEGYTRKEFDAELWPPIIMQEEGAPLAEDVRATKVTPPRLPEPEVVQEGEAPIEDRRATIAEPPVPEEPLVSINLPEPPTITAIPEDKAEKYAESRQEFKNLKTGIWYKDLINSIQQTQFNIQMMGMEGVDDLRVAMGRMIGMDSEPLISPIVDTLADVEERTGVPASQFLPWPAQSFWDGSFLDYRDSIERMGHPLVQLAPVGAGLSVASKLPMIARYIEKIPKIWQMVFGAGAAEGIAFSGDEPNVADFVTTPATEWLEKKPDDSELEGRAKNAIQGMLMVGGLKGVGTVAKYGTNKIFQNVDKVIGKGDKILKPLKDRVRDEGHPLLAARMDKFELESNVMFADHFQRMVPFLKGLKKMSKKDRAILDLAAKNSDIVAVNRVLTRYQGKIPGIKSAFKEVRETLNDLWILADKNGIDVNYTKDYIPRFVKDYDELRKALKLGEKKELDRMLQEARDKLYPKGTGTGRPLLTAHERMEVVNKFFSKKGIGDRLGWTEKRAIAELETELMPHYLGLEESLARYTRSVAYQVSKNRLVGKSPQFSDTSYQKIAGKLHAQGEISSPQMEKVRHLFNVRLKGGESQMGDAFKLYRDMVYMTTIGNPMSALTQVSEIGLNAYRNGLLPSIKGTIRKKPVKLKDLGIEDISAELADPSKMSKGLRDMLKFSGFKKMDVVMKEANLASSLEKTRKQVMNKNSKAFKEFESEYGAYFGGEFDDLVKSLRANDINNDNVKLLLYSRLTKTQPIALSEMTEAYIAGGGFSRSMYFLKSFAMKQFNVVRQDVIKQLANPKTTKEGMKNLMRLGVYFGGSTTGVNWMKDFVLGREFELSDQMVSQGLMLFGQTKYVTYQAKREGAMGVALAYLPVVPANRMLRELIASGIDGDLERAKESWKYGVEAVPLGGKVASWRVPGLPGHEKTKKDIVDKFYGRD